MTDRNELLAYDIRALDAAELAASRTPRKGRAARLALDRAMATGRQVEARVKARAEARAVSAGIAETVALAQARGEEIASPGGRVTMLGRDGMKYLFEKGRLTVDQYEAGKRYRDFYENGAGGLKSCLAEASRSGSEDEASRRQRLIAWAWMCKSIEHAVELHDATGRSVTLLRKVAGEGVALNAMNKGGGKGFDACLRQLKDALDIAAEIIGRKSVAQQLRDVIDHVKDMDVLIKQAR